MGGFHMLGRSIDSVRTPEQLESARRSCVSLALDGLVGTFCKSFYLLAVLLLTIMSSGGRSSFQRRRCLSVGILSEHEYTHTRDWCAGNNRW